MELFGEKLVLLALIDKDGTRIGLLPHEKARVPLLPARAVGAEIVAERLLAPWYRHGIGDRREGRNRLVARWILERDDERTMAAHRMAENAAPVGTEGKVRLNERAQFPGRVAVHAVMAAPGLGLGVKVKSGACAEIPTFIFARKTKAARAGIARHQDDTEFSGKAKRPRLDHESLFRAGKARQVIERGQLAGLRLGRDEDRKLHLGAGFGRGMIVKPDHTPKTRLFAASVEH